jgi:hypothetical protein
MIFYQTKFHNTTLMVIVQTFTRASCWYCWCYRIQNCEYRIPSNDNRLYPDITLQAHLRKKSSLNYLELPCRWSTGYLTTSITYIGYFGLNEMITYGEQEKTGVKQRNKRLTATCLRFVTCHKFVCRLQQMRRNKQKRNDALCNGEQRDVPCVVWHG